MVKSVHEDEQFLSRKGPLRGPFFLFDFGDGVCSVLEVPEVFVV